jgi:hypothetical protein
MGKILGGGIMKIKKLLAGAGLLVLMAAPMAVHADSIDFNVNVGADDEAHYHFSHPPSGHHSEIYWAAKKIQEAKHKIWNARKKHNFGGHAENSIQMLNGALDELRMAEDYAHSH